jgi:hypothetical protein
MKWMRHLKYNPLEIGLKEAQMKHKNKAFVLLLCGTLLMVSCKKEKPGWQGTVEEVDGVVVVKNPKEPMEENYEIEFVEDLFIGVEEGDKEYMLYRPNAIDADSGGNIYILDSGAIKLRKYDAQGKFIMDLSREGQGPGELEYPSAFCLDSQNNVYIVDIRKIEVLDENGVYQRTFKFDFSISAIVIDDRSHLILGYHSYKETADGEVSDFARIAYFDPATEDLFDFYIQERMTFRTVQNDDLYFEFPYFVRWDRDSGGNIYAATATDYTIHVFSPEGKLRWKFSRDIDPLPVENSIKKKVIEQLGGSELPDRKVSESQDYRKYLEHHAVFASISVDEEDRIWVENYYPRVIGRTRGFSTYDVFSSDGKFLFEARIDLYTTPRLIFKNGYIYTLAVDESGFRRAVRLKMLEKKKTVP